MLALRVELSSVARLMQTSRTSLTGQSRAPSDYTSIMCSTSSAVRINHRTALLVLHGRRQTTTTKPVIGADSQLSTGCLRGVTVKVKQKY